MVTEFPLQYPRVIEATIASGASISSVIDLGMQRAFIVDMPAIWTAANLTFLLSFDGGATWKPFYDENGNEIVVIAAAAESIHLGDAQQWAAIWKMKIRSGTTATPVAQAAARTLKIISRDL